MSFMKVVVAISSFNHVKTGLKMGLTLKEKNSNAMPIDIKVLI